MNQLVEKVIDQLKDFVKMYNIESLFVVDQYPRCFYFDTNEDINEIEIVSAYDKQHIILGELFASEILNKNSHLDKNCLIIDLSEPEYNLKLSFQSYSKEKYLDNQDIVLWLKKNKIENNPLNNNIYSKPFTIDGLVYSPFKDSCFDPVGSSEKDLSEKRISSILPEELLIKYNPESILKALYFSVAHEFDIDVRLKQIIRNNIVYLKEFCHEDRILKKLLLMLKIDPEQSLKLFKDLGLDVFLLNDQIKEILATFYG